MRRIALIPFILVFLIPNALTGGIPLQARLLTAGIIFGVAMLTDLFDGMIARKFNAVTNFGKFIDPIADKLLVICVMMAFVDMELISSIPVIIILVPGGKLYYTMLGAVSSDMAMFSAK